MKRKILGFALIGCGLVDLAAVSSGIVKDLCRMHHVPHCGDLFTFLIGAVGVVVMCWGALIVEPEGL